MRKFHGALFYLLLLFSPTQLGFHFWPSWALVLGRRVDYLSPTLFFTDILIMAILTFWFIEMVLKVKNNKLKAKISNIRFIPSSPLLYISLFVVCIYANIRFAASWQIALYTWVKVFEFVLLGLYIVKTKPNILRVILFISIPVLYSSVLAIVQFIQQHSVGGILWFLGERMFSVTTPGIAQIPLCLPGAVSCPLVLRPYATLPHPNVLGGFLAVILPIILMAIFTEKKSNVKKYYFVVFGISIIGLALSFSRSAWVAGAVGICFAIIVMRNKSQSFVKILSPLFRYVPLLLLFGCVVTYVVLLNLGNSESVLVRRELISSSVNIWQATPVIGVGLGNFLVTLPHYLPSRTIYFLQPVHNIYLLILSEAGIVGVVLLTYFIVSIIKKYELGIKNLQKNDRSIRFIIFVSVLLFLTLGLIDHYPLSLQQGRLLLTLLVGLSLV
jgi:O-antigen ligase